MDLINLVKVTCPKCGEETLPAEYCRICERRIAYNCPICGSLHLKGTAYCRNSGVCFDGYKKLLEMIIDLLDNFESSEEYKEWRNSQFNSCTTAVISIMFCLVSGICATIHGQYQSILGITASIFGIIFILNLIYTANINKTKRHALKKYLKKSGLLENDLFKNVTYNYRYNRHGYLEGQIALCEMILKPVERP